MTADLQGEKWPFHLLNMQLWCHSADAGSSRGVTTSGWQFYWDTAQHCLC